MKPNGRTLACALALVTALASIASAQVEPIFTAVPPGLDGTTLIFPNDIPPDPDHKVFHFIGVAESHGFPEPSTLTVFFDWILPTGGVGTSPPVTFTMAPFMGAPVETSYVLDFCPNEVSIHFLTSSPAGASVSGSFTHLCLPVPEPSALAALAIPASLLLRRKRPCAAAAARD